MQNTKSYVDSIFSAYEETAELADFKEELTGYLDDKIASLVRKGEDESAAFDKAQRQLGDISALADQISLKKKQELIGEAFMDIKRFMTPRRVAAYIAAGVCLAFGLLCAAIAFFGSSVGASGGPTGLSNALGAAFPDFNSVLLAHAPRRSFAALFGVLFVFVPIALAAFTWLGLTQETAELHPVSGKRAAWYSAAALVLCAGAILVPLVFFGTESGVSVIAALGVLIPFALPSIGLFVYLVLTEKERRKPWARLRDEAASLSEPSDQVRFGIFSGAIWMAAIAFFVLFGFIVGFRFSWVAFLFAVAAQLFVQGIMMKRELSRRS